MTIEIDDDALVARFVELSRRRIRRVVNAFSVPALALFVGGIVLAFAVRVELALLMVVGGTLMLPAWVVNRRAARLERGLKVILSQPEQVREVEVLAPQEGGEVVIVVVLPDFAVRLPLATMTPGPDGPRLTPLWPEVPPEGLVDALRRRSTRPR